MTALQDRLRLLPQFTVAHICDRASEPGCTGAFDSRVSRVRPCWCYLYVDQSGFVHGRLFRRFAIVNRYTFRPKDARHISLLAESVAYPYFDGYWGERAVLVLDRSRHWTRTAFKPRDAVRVHPDGTERVIARGWDHEHCAICTETISAHVQPWGYTDQKLYDWICKRCFSECVEPGDLPFIDDYTVRQIRGLS